MKDNRSSKQNRSTDYSSDWQASSRWFDERQSRITTGSYSRDKQESSGSRRPSADTGKNSGVTTNKTQPAKSRRTAEKISPREKKKKDKERRQLNKYYRKNRNSGKSKDELRKEYAANAKKRRRCKVVKALLFTLLMAASAFVVLSLTVLFKIETVSVEGDTRYSSKEIIEQSQVEIGDNLWLTTSSKVTEKVSVALPYVKSVEVKRTIPSGVVLEVTETTPKYSVKNKKKYVLMDENGKVLETNGKKGKTVLLTGIEFEEFVPGMKAKAVTEENYALAMEIVSYGENSGLSFTKINVKNVNQMTAIYKGKIRLEFGSGADLETKMKMAEKIINTLEEEKNDQEGVINLKSVTKAFFREQELNPTTTEPETTSEDDKNTDKSNNADKVSDKNNT